jgi:hypothetical protein
VGLLALGAFAVGCSDEAGLGLTPPYLNASTDTIDFGDTTIGSAEERTVFIINTGQVPMKLELPTGDTRGGIFAVLVDQLTVQPTKDTVISLGFRPADPMTYTTTISVINNSSNRAELFLKLRGRGVRPGPCENVDCRRSPNPTCIGESQVRRFLPAGVCDESNGECVHQYNDEDCMFGCDQTTGVCRGDPCLGMSCSTPPNNCYFANGTCENGACRFEVNNNGQCDDNSACTTADHCSEGTCVGTATQCVTPPEAICVDSSTRRVWQPQGACNPTNGGCEYTSSDQHCDFGCTPSGCNGDPCQGITCNTPPNGACYAPTGTCSMGVCTYATVANTCDDGNACTTGDTCNNGTCGGSPMVCNSPPGPDCPTGTDVRVYNATGTCNAGVCEYGSATRSCNDNNACTTSDACLNGLCANTGALACNDGNACTTDSCDPIASCVYNGSTGGACITGSGECPSGTCASGTCIANPGITCVTEIELDLCQDVEVAGVCSASGECVVSSAPPGFTCPGCNGICIQCFIQLCFPF